MIAALIDNWRPKRLEKSSPTEFQHQFAAHFHARYKKRPDFRYGTFSYGMPVIRDWGQKPGGPKVTIGNYCSFGKNVQIMLDGDHHPNWVTCYPLPSTFPGIMPHKLTAKGDVVIGNDVWLGSDSIILPGVTIGDGAIVGAGAVVSRDVPAYAVAVGNPARVVRQRFNDTQIAALLQIAWWQWPEDKVKQFMPLLCQPDIDEFIKAAQV